MSCSRKVISSLEIYIEEISVRDGQLFNCIKSKDPTDLVCLSEWPIGSLYSMVGYRVFPI